MNDFRFLIFGAGSIANKFADAVVRTPGASVCAIASKSMERARAFAEKNNIPAAYDSYEAAIAAEKPDAVYIATTVNFHYDQTMLCIRYGIPVLCEKAMFANSRDAIAAFSAAKEAGVFVMEAMWARFLPHMKKAAQWIRDGELGTLLSIDANLGYLPTYAPENRFFNKELGGGVGRDLLVYCYELVRMLAGDEKPQEVWGTHINGETGVDVANLVGLKFSTYFACLRAYFTAYGQGDIFRIYGTDGMIEIPSPHVGRDCTLYRKDGTKEHYDDPIENGFIFEVQEVIDCVRAGKLESDVVPWDLTIDCARLFDEMI